MCPPSSDIGPPTLNNDPAFGIMQVEEKAHGDACEENISLQPQPSCCGSGGSRQSSVVVIGGDQDLERAAASKKLQRALVVCCFFMLLEIVGGSLAGSLSILSDAAHLLSDVAGFAISLLALRASKWKATPQYTYGFIRLEVLGALVSVQSIWIMTGFIVYEAFQRLYLGTHLVDGRLMCLVATFGVAVNLVMIFVLGHGHEHEHEHGDGACEGHSLFSFHHHHHEHRKVDVEHGQCISHKQKHVHHEEELKQKHSSCAGGCHHHDEDKPTTIKVLKHSHSGQKPLAAEGEEEIVSLMSSDNSPSDEDEHSHKEVHVGCSAKEQCSNKEENGNINLRGAYLHALGDLIQSVGVLITGVVIWIKPEWQLIDLMCSFFFSIVVMSTTFRMVKDVLSILMESTPRDVDVGAVNKGLLGIPGVVAVQQLHIWALTTGTNALTCHLHIKPTSGGAQANDILHTATQYCAVDQKIKHVTIQIEDTSS